MASLTVNGAALLADPSGVAFWPDRATLLVADLHLEKGSSYARTRQFLPPYDSRATLAALQAAIDRWAPRRVICLGDSFHDADAAQRLPPAERAALGALTGALDWIWIAGNHDPAPPAEWGGSVAAEVTDGPLVLRHAAADGPAPGEVSGHYHPKARVSTRAGPRAARCFVSDGSRLILPSFGAYTGGLDVRDPAIAGHFPAGFEVLMLGREKLHRFRFAAGSRRRRA